MEIIIFIFDCGQFFLTAEIMQAIVGNFSVENP